MTRRPVLLSAAAVAGVAAALAVGRWRLDDMRRARHARVGARLAGTAALTRDAALHWERELERDTRIAVAEAPNAPRPLEGYAGLWRVTRADFAAPSAASSAAPPLTAAERAAADSTLADGRLRLAGPFAAATPSGVAVSACARLPDGRAAVVLRSDPGPTLLALAARHVRGSTENGRLAALAGDTVHVVSPGGAGFTFRSYPLARFAPEVRRLLLQGSPGTGPPSAGLPGAGAAHADAPYALYHDLAGREVLAVVERVPGTSWGVLRQVEAAEIEAGVRRTFATEALLVLAAAGAAGLGARAAVRAERARRLRELAASEAQLAATLRASFDAVLAVDAHERIVFCNAAAERLLRAGPGELAGRHLSTVMAPACRERMLAGYRRFVAGPGTALTLPARPGVALVAGDGTPLPRVEVALSKGEAAGGRLCMCIVRDVSDREAAAEALRASEASARAFVEHSPYGICRVSVDGRFTTVNPALAHMLGYAGTAELCEADLGDLYVDPAARAEVLRRHAEGQARVCGVETRWRRRDGTTLPVRLHSCEVRDAAGAIAYYEAFVTDLGALREAEQALRHAERLAAVGRFVSGVAHELNNPLSAVLLFTDGLLEEPGRPDADREALALVRAQALRARAVVRDLLAFVRGAGSAAGTVDAREALAAAARALAPQAAAAGGRLEVALGVPVGGAPGVVLGAASGEATGGDLGRLRVDQAGLEQVVANLVVNALHAAPGGTVRLAAARDGRSLRVTVDDEGPGIAPEVQARMFEPFFTTKPVGAGTGLGLSVSLGIVERYGGTLAGANRAAGEAPGLGAGARFTVTLPLAPGDGAEAPAAGPPNKAEGATYGATVGGAAVDGAALDGAASDGAASDTATRVPPSAPAPAPPARAPRLLVVDDEAPIRQALARFFARRGWAVDQAGDGRAAFARLLDAEAAGAPYDLVVSDVRMPDVSGVALHDWLARTRPALLERVVFATGDDASPESADFVRRTRCRVLEKPFDPEALATLAALAALGIAGGIPGGAMDGAAASDAARGPDRPASIGAD